MTADSTGIESELLEGLSLFKDLDEDNLESAASECEIHELPPKSLVFKKGSRDEWTQFVLSGHVVLIQEDGSHESLIGMGNAGIVDSPLGWEQPHEINAFTHTDVKLIRIKTDRLKELIENSRPPELDVAEVDEDTAGVSTQIYFQLFNDLMNDKLKLPSMPDIAIRVREAVSDVKAGAQEVAKIIQSDPVVAARIIQAANSAMYAGQRQVDSVSAAVVRLGLTTTRELVMAVTLRDVFKSKSPLLNKRMVETWMHSTMVAAIASVLSKRIRGFLPDRALLAGLIHDIGVVPMLAHAEKYPELIEDPLLLAKTIEEHKGQIGSMIMRKWNFPDDLADVPANCDEWMREHDEKGDYCDLIIVSQLHSINSVGIKGDYPSIDQVPAIHRLDFKNPSDEVAPSEILNEAREDIASVQKMLIGG